jgi:hypothetical protein
MEVIRGDGTLLADIDLAPANTHQEVIQNVAVILSTVQKSCPMFRGLGLPSELYGRPLNVVENILVGYLYDQIEEYEPRAIISEINFETESKTGKMIPIITLEGVKEEDE